MVKRNKRPRNKDTKSQKKKKKRNQHFGMAPPVIHKNWDRRKTLRQNYEKMGVVLNANMAAVRVGSGATEKKTEEKVGYLTEELEVVASLPKPEPYVPKSMGIREQHILMSLMNKHGDDVEAMARDFKVNVMQETAGVLKKRIVLLKQLQSL